MIKNSFFKTGTKYGKNQQKLPGDISQILFSKSLYFCLEQKHWTWKKCHAKIYLQWTIWGVTLEKVIVFRMSWILYKISYWFLIHYKNNFQVILIIIIFRIIWILFSYINCFVFKIDQKIMSYLDILNDKILKFFTAHQWNLVFHSINNYI